MLEQTYDDWRRMLAAVQAADAAPCVQGFDDDTLTPQRMPVRCYEVAVALGIDKRKRLSWHDSFRIGKTSKFPEENVNASVSRCTHTPHCGYLHVYANVLRSDDTWEASVFATDSRAKIVRVTGHPTRKGAVEHLERLLGHSRAPEVPNDRA